MHNDLLTTDTILVESYAGVAVRTTTVYLFLLVMVRIMGKREIGQLSPFDLVVAITIGELAAVALELESDLVKALVPIALIVLFELLLSYASLKSHVLRRLITGSPTVVIENGTILYENLRRNRYNMSDLLSQLREKDIFSPSEVEYAILEPSGRLSVLKKSQDRAVTPADLHIDTGYEGLPVPLVCDGMVQINNLEKLSLSTDWLNDQLKSRGIRDVHDVALALIDTGGELYISRKSGPPERAAPRA